MPSTTCPSHEQLVALASGKLHSHALDAIAAHLDRCSQCLSTLEGLGAPSDQLLLGIRNAGGVGALTAALAAPARLGQYELLEKLGQGGMGSVYKARHLLLNRLMAVKILPAERLHDPAAIARFRREIEAVGKLHHSNIVAASDAGVADGSHFLVMELVDGTDLGCLVKRRKPLRVADACELVRQAAVGLQHVHENGLVHRDIKPSNLMLTTAGQVKVLDLGLALLHGSAPVGAELTAAGQVMGTLDYMAPEQAFDTHHVDIRADLYGLGGTLYFLLTGEPPFPTPGKSPFEKMLAHSREPVPSVRVWRPDVPAGLADVLGRLLAKKPEDRFATPDEAAAALAPFSLGCDLRSVLAQAEGSEAAVAPGTAPDLSSPLVETDSPHLAAPTRTSAPARRGWRLVGVAAILAVALGGAAYWFGPTVIRVATNQGQLTVRTVDNDVELTVKRGGEIVEVFDLKTKQKINLPVGEYELALKGGKEGLGLRTKHFTITRGGEVIAEVIWEPVADKGDGKKPPPAGDGGKKPSPSGDGGKKQLAGPRQLGTWEPGPEDTTLSGYIPRPATLPGIRRWQIESITPYWLISALAWSPNSRLLACGSSPNSTSNVRVFDVCSGRPTLVIRIQDLYDWGTMAVAWSPDSKSLALGGAGGMWVWDVDDKRRRWSPSEDSKGPEAQQARQTLCLAWSPNGKWLASGHRTKTVAVWDAATGKLEATFSESQGEVTLLAWSANSGWLAAGSKEGAVRLWNVSAKKAGPVLPDHVAGAQALAWEPDGTRLAYIASGKALKIWDAVKGKKVQRLLVEGGDPASVVWRSQSPNLTVLTREGRLWLWDAAAEKQVPAPTEFQAQRYVAWSPDGKWLASDYWASRLISSGLEVWDVAQWKRRAVFRSGDPVMTAMAAVGPEGDCCAVPCYDGLVRIFDVADGKPRRAAGEFRPGGEMKDRILHCVDWSPDGQRLVTGGFDRHVRVWDALTGKDESRLQETLPASGWANAVAWSSNGNRIALGAFAGDNLRVWNGATRKEQWTARGHDNAVSRVAWSPDGKLLATGGEDCTVRVWAAADGGKLWSWRRPDQVGNFMITAVAWSPDGKRLATASSQDRMIHILDSSAGREVKSFPVPGQDWEKGMMLDWSHDGKRLLASSVDGARVLDVHDGITVLILKGARGGGAYSAWGRDERYILAACGDGSVRAWDASTSEPLWVGLALPGGKTAVFSAAGELLHADPGAEDELVYLVEDDQGRIDVVTAAEFAARHGRKRGP